MEMFGSIGQEFVNFWEVIAVFVGLVAAWVTIIRYNKDDEHGKKQISATNSVTEAVQGGNEDVMLIAKVEHAPDFGEIVGSTGTMDRQGFVRFKNFGEKARITGYKDFSMKCYLNDNKPEKFPYEIRTDNPLVITYSYKPEAFLQGVGWASDIKVHFKVQFKDMTGRNKYELEYSSYIHRRNSEEDFNVEDV